MPEEQNAKATVYFFRFKGFPPSALEPIIYYDGKELARMDNGRFFAVKLDAGKHTFRTEHMKKTITTELKSGQTFYFEVKHVPRFPTGRGLLISIDKTTGEAIFKNLEKLKLKPLDANKIKEASDVVVDKSL